MNKTDILPPIKIGVSACLIGEKVRYDGSDKYNATIVESIGNQFELVSVCPEVAIGLGVPRQPIQLIHKNNGVCAVRIDDPGIDVTRQLQAFGRQQAALVDALCGYIFKSRSPSCGVSDTPIVSNEGGHQGAGLFAEQIIKEHPSLPVIDEVVLSSNAARENFLARVYSLARWHQLLTKPLGIDALRAFHLAHASILARHDETLSTELDRYLSTLGSAISEAAAQHYLLTFMACMKTSGIPAGQ